MKKISVLVSLLLSVTIILTILNATFLIEIFKDNELRANFYLGTELNSNYTELEKVHMQEVKNLVLTSIILNIILFIIIKYNKKHTNSKLTGYSLLIVLALLGIPSLISFQTFFTNFHLIFFDSNNWILPSNSILIQHYPLPYYKSVILKISIILIALSLLLIFINKLIPKDLIKRNN